MMAPRSKETALKEERASDSSGEREMNLDLFGSVANS